MGVLEKYSVMEQRESKDGGTSKTISPWFLAKPSGTYVDAICSFSLWYCNSS